MWLTPSPPVTWARYSAPSHLPQKTVFTGVFPRRVTSISSSALRMSRPFSFRMWAAARTCLEDVLPAAQLLNVGIADVGDDPHLGPDDVPQVVDLPNLSIPISNTPIW